MLDSGSSTEKLRRDDYENGYQLARLGEGTMDGPTNNEKHLDFKTRRDHTMWLVLSLPI